MDRYIVTLTDEERDELKKLVQKGGKVYRIRHANILLNPSQSPGGMRRTFDDITAAHGGSPNTISWVAKRFVTDGMEAALGRKTQENHFRKVMGEVEANICLIACSDPPEGKARWTLQMVADRLVILEIVDSISNSTVGVAMNKMATEPWIVEQWCIPAPGAEFVAPMEDVPDVYGHPYDPARPVVCIDETNRQLAKETRLPVTPDHNAIEDSNYRCNGTVNVTMAFEPLAGQRDTVITPTRTSIDFAMILRHTVDDLYPDAKKIVLVTDNLNTHKIASLCKAFPPEEAHRLANRFEWHCMHPGFTGAGLTWPGIMPRQALAKPLPDL